MNGNNDTADNLKQHTPKSVVNVAVLGAESTGKTTLCSDLAAHFKCLWVPEYMRTYLQAKWDNEQQTCTWDDLLPIAQGQTKKKTSWHNKRLTKITCYFVIPACLS